LIIEPREPKVLIYDIETSFNILAAFQLLNLKPLPHDSILKERYIICASWKWLGEEDIHHISVNDFYNGYDDDVGVVETLHEVISSADVIIAHYGDRFDLPYVNTRSLFHGLDPLAPVPTIDTYKIAKRHFKFNSNRLDYLGKFLGVGGKIHTDQSLWLKCLLGDTSAIEDMVTYNIQDVKLLEEVYLKLRPYAPAIVNRALFKQSNVCPSCGSSEFIKYGFKYNRTRVVQRYRCSGCGHVFTDTKSVKGIVAEVK